MAGEVLNMNILTINRIRYKLKFYVSNTATNHILNTVRL